MKPATSVIDRLRTLGAYDWVERTCKARGVAMGDVLRDGRAPYVVRVRHEVWCVVRDTFDLGLAETGRLFGRDHTSILSGIRKYETRRMGNGLG